MTKTGTRAIAFFDLHVNKYSQFSTHRDRLSDCLKVIDDVFKYATHYEADTILFGGDMGDLPKYIYIQVLNSLCLRLSKWFTKYPNVTMYAISGNHDQNSKNYWEKPADTLLTFIATAFPGRFVLIDNMFIQHMSVAGIPYYENKSSFDKALDAMVEEVKPYYKKNKVTLLIHQTPEGIFNKHIKAETSPSDPRYEYFAMVLDGHIHTSQRLSPKFLIGGNPLHRDLGDLGNEKGIWLLDLANPTDCQFISRKGRYAEFRRMKHEDITEEDLQNSFVVPIIEAKKELVADSADPALYNTAVKPEDLLRNYWQQQNGTDERLLKIGLSLLS